MRSTANPDVGRYPLDIRDLVVRADDGRPLVSVPSLAITTGTSLGISGPSGAGKSTLLYAMAGLIACASGSIRWGNIDLAKLGERERSAFRAERMGMIFQDFLLFEELDALANAALPCQFRPRRHRAAFRENARVQLQRLGIEPTARRVVSYSGGERQRVAVARALATDPAIVLADEPTASLHRDAADALIDDLLALVAEGQRSLILVTHDRAVLSRLDRVIELVDGHPVSDSATDTEAEADDDS